MLARIVLYAVFLEVCWSLGVDDTEKRRSEEILRAVAAAATADYEGIQQMKLQKSRTFATLSAARSTAECVEKLQAHLRKEESDLQKESETARTDLENKLTKNVQYEAEDMKKALHNALQSVYMSVHDRYKQVQEHASAMMKALQEEVDETSLNDEHAGSNLNAENIFKAIIQKTAYQLAAVQGNDDLTRRHWKDPDDYSHANGFEFEDEVLAQLNGMLLAQAQEDVYGTAGFRNDVNCEWVAGDGQGAKEIDVGYVDSAEKCMKLVRSKQPTANGATVETEASAGQDQPRACYAEFKMNSVYDDADYQTCRLYDEDVQTSLIALNTILAGPERNPQDLICNWVNGDGWGGMQKDVGNVDSADECEKLVRSEHPSANGATYGRTSHPIEEYKTKCYVWYHAKGIMVDPSDPYDIHYDTCLFSNITGGHFDHSEIRSTIDSGWGHSNGNWTHELTSDFLSRTPAGTSWEGRVKFEDEQLIKVEQAFIEYIKWKSHFHNRTIGHSALDSAKVMVQAKIDALTKSKDNIAVYEVELDSLQDDEMRRIADIKEEFESLAADWLQLATYHCCDIVQGNTVECEDATNHLVEPVDKVFPGALKKPDPARDCTRRLL